MSNERIRQAFTSEFASHFRQAGEMKFLDINHCITCEDSEDDFWFVTKYILNPTADGRQFVKGNYTT